MLRNITGGENRSGKFMIVCLPMQIAAISHRYNSFRWKTVMQDCVAFELRQGWRTFGKILFQSAAELEGGALFPGIDFQKPDDAVMINDVIAAEYSAVTSPPELPSCCYRVLFQEGLACSLFTTEGKEEPTNLFPSTIFWSAMPAIYTSSALATTASTVGSR